MVEGFFPHYTHFIERKRKKSHSKDEHGFSLQKDVLSFPSQSRDWSTNNVLANQETWPLADLGARVNENDINSGIQGRWTSSSFLVCNLSDDDKRFAHTPEKVSGRRRFLNLKLISFLSSILSALFGVFRYSTPNRLKILSAIIFFLLASPSSAFCPAGCKCNDLSLTVECKNASIDVIPFLLNPEVKYLKLSCNKIESVQQSLAFYPELIALDISYNVLTHLIANDFESQAALKILKLDHNKIATVSNRSFTGLEGIQELFLNHNSISQLESGSFNSLDSLTYLDLSNNKLKYLSGEQLAPLRNLQILKLNYNKFQNPQLVSFKHLPNLEKLEFDGNVISSVPKSAFSPLNHLKFLSLDKNSISVISDDAFENLTNLSSLSLVDNRLSFIPSKSFRYLHQLQVLDLSGNMFQSVQQSPFFRLKNLQQLHIARCPRMFRISSDAFSGINSVEVLNLSYNTRLLQIGDAVFSHLNKLAALDLTACGIVYISSSQVPSGHSTVLHLAGNPLHCNCSLLWLVKPRSNSSFYIKEAKCATPPELYGIDVNEVNLNEIGCETSLGLTAVGICIGVSLLGLLIIGLFLAWRWRKKEPLSSTKTALPYCGTRRDRDTVPPRVNLQGPPPPPVSFHTPPVYNPKLSVSVPNGNYPQTVFSPFSPYQCHHECHAGTCCPYTVHPATRPLLPPPTPSPSHPFDWIYPPTPSPYEEETHWYTTIGRDGREYLTGEAIHGGSKKATSDTTTTPSSTPTPSTPSVKVKRSDSILKDGPIATIRDTPQITSPSPIDKSSFVPNPPAALPVTYI